MQTFIFSFLLALSITSYAGERLKTISGSMKESSSSWFSRDDESDKELEEKVAEPIPEQEPQKLVNAAPTSYYDEEAGCLMTKAYILDVENPEQYERIEDYPYTYECAMRR